MIFAMRRLLSDALTAFFLPSDAALPPESHGIRAVSSTGPSDTSGSSPGALQLIVWHANAMGANILGFGCVGSVTSMLYGAPSERTTRVHSCRSHRVGVCA